MGSITAMSAPSLEILGYDILLQVCHLVKELPPFTVREEWMMRDKGRELHKPLLALSQTSRMMRSLCVDGLFKEITISSEADTLSGGREWPLKKVSALKGCPVVTANTRALTFDTFWTKDGERGPPPPTLVSELSKLIASMNKLNKLVLAVSEHNAQICEQVLMESQPSLLGVKSLVLHPWCEFAVGMCPNVEFVSMNSFYEKPDNAPRFQFRHSSFKLIEALAKAPKLLRLDLVQFWGVEHLEALIKNLANLRCLAMQGAISRGGIAVLLPLLSKMTNLDTLMLAHVADLRVGFNPPRCGNAYIGEGGDRARARVAQKSEEATEKVMRMVVDAFGQDCRLKELWVGNRSKFELLSDREGPAEWIKSKGDRSLCLNYHRA